jgi:hypothetical protein
MEELIDWVEEKYHVVVTLGYSFILAVIVLVLRMTLVERIAVWAFGVIFVATLLRRIRKGLDARPKFDLDR